MIVHKKRRALILKVRHPERITSVIPTAKSFQYKGTTLVAVPHKTEEVRVLRNIGIEAPNPILYYYDWPRAPYIKAPFQAQIATAAFLTGYNRAYCHNGLGSGKTQATLWAYDFLRAQKLVRSMLVVSPLSTLERTWGDSIFDHFPHLSFVVLHGTRERRLKLLQQPADIYIINHDGLKVVAHEIVKQDHIDLVVVDEIAQAARNAQTDRWDYLNWVVNGKSPTKQVELPDGRTCRSSVGKPGKVRGCWGLTGTPTPNEPTDAWAQCRLVTPETVPPYFNKFKEMVMRQVGPFSWVSRDNATDVVFNTMQPAIRFSREECVDLPPTTFTTREVSLTPEQAKAYKNMETKLFAEVESGKVLAVNEAVKVNKLVQICAGVLYDEHGNEVAMPCKPRLDVVAEIIEEADGKVIVFVPFVSSIALVANDLRKRGFSVEVIYGDVPKSKRDEVFSAFQKTQHPRVLVAQPAAMSHGLTLTAANTTVWYAPTNSADIYEQANARTTRPGQKRNTLIVNIEGSPIERKMYTRLKTKQKMQNMLLEMIQEARK
jgi:hypothetical protein